MVLFLTKTSIFSVGDSSCRVDLFGHTALLVPVVEPRVFDRVSSEFSGWPRLILLRGSYLTPLIVKFTADFSGYCFRGGSRLTKWYH